ncbi:hypothetical protein CAPTEDRAFT_161725 [Capitella teleta]|uniref:Angiotensin-converting enzyme n=1 Tax=Capitella teleta TaxID=283909 RepID=R7VEF0_CAPTE|nr:hypothetical protein CAPTEDRAFT_161725 [Capitella teleta]|eukprot:ELU17193.1 hypothetical protein CAPTEDRAFT_161725 [Capitella teleta]
MSAKDPFGDGLNPDQSLYPLDEPLNDDVHPDGDQLFESLPSDRWPDADTISDDLRRKPRCCWKSRPCCRRAIAVFLLLLLLVVLVVMLAVLLTSSNKSSIERRASEWMKETNDQLQSWNAKTALAGWNYYTNITDESAKELAKVESQLSEWKGQRQIAAKEFLKNSDDSWDQDLRRQLSGFQNTQSPVPKEPATQERISELTLNLEKTYSGAKVRKDGKVFKLDPELKSLMKTSRDWDELLWAWQAWHDVTGINMRDNYTLLVDEMNVAARDNGFADIGVPWRLANFEEDEELIKIVDELYEQTKPLYKQLHAFVRHRLMQAYPGRGIEEEGSIPAHILGNMWGHSWSDILDLLTPYPDSPSYDVSDTMRYQGYTPRRIFELADEFFVSIGMDAMTSSFWENTMMVRPENDTIVACHASAHDMYQKSCQDFRIKMCTEVGMQNLHTVHHEMGHVQYFMQYCHLPSVFKNSPNSAFHEAIGDVIALSVSTPAHLQAVNLLNETTLADAEQIRRSDINFLMKSALDKISFLPYAYTLDKWRWDVFSGEILPQEMNSKWWEYRLRYQGLKPPIQRNESNFDPGAKYHVPANVPYIRYFLSYIAQFQFHESLCEATGHAGPLHKCDIYRSKAAGDRLKSMLKLGSSKPWPEAMETMTGQRKFSADAIKNYFDPLVKWLEEFNANRTVGWSL